MQFQPLEFHLFSKADLTTMVLMDITSTMFMERDLLNLDIFMESITVNNMSVNHILAMQSMLPILIEFCRSLRLYLIISLICENNLNRIKN